MKSRFVKSIVLAAVGSLMMVGSAMAASIPYWYQTSDTSEFYMYNNDGTIEFGYYQVDSIENPDINSVTLNTLFSPVLAPPIVDAQIDAPLVPDFFGFYVRTTTGGGNNIWLSDSTIIGPATGGDLLGLNIFSQPDRFTVNPLTINNGWEFQFTSQTGAIVRFQTLGDDIRPVPEPATMLLFGAGLAGLAGIARRKKINNI